MLVSPNIGKEPVLRFVFMTFFTRAFFQYIYIYHSFIYFPLSPFGCWAFVCTSMNVCSIESRKSGTRKKKKKGLLLLLLNERILVRALVNIRMMMRASPTNPEIIIRPSRLLVRSRLVPFLLSQSTPEIHARFITRETHLFSGEGNRNFARRKVMYAYQREAMTSG